MLLVLKHTLSPSSLLSSSINRAKLKGYISACNSMLDTQVEEQTVSICEIEKKRKTAMKVLLLSFALFL